MKKVTAAVALVAVLSLCACSGFSVEDKLAAPSLTADQSAVIAAIEGGEQKITLLYPSSGDRRTPIQFIDLDGDNVNEAAVFFTVSGDDETSRLAVLEKDLSGKWQIVSSVVGAGIDVESVSTIRIKDEPQRALLVEWTADGRTTHSLVAYIYRDSEVQTGYQCECYDMLACDVDGDSYLELCYIERANVYDPFFLHSVKITGDEFSSMGSLELSESMMECIALSAGKLGDGRSALFVDEDLGNGYMSTEVFVSELEKLTRVALAGETSLAELTRRATSAPVSRTLFSSSSTYIPTDSPPLDNVLMPEAWTYWYTITADAPEYVLSSYIESGYKLALFVPDEWLPIVTVSRSDSEARLIIVKNTVVDDAALMLKILTVGEDARPYTADGYVMVAQSGSYRYYLKGNCPESEFDFICDNFTVL